MPPCPGPPDELLGMLDVDIRQDLCVRCYHLSADRSARSVALADQSPQLSTLLRHFLHESGVQDPRSRLEVLQDRPSRCLQQGLGSVRTRHEPGCVFPSEDLTHYLSPKRLHLLRSRPSPVPLLVVSGTSRPIAGDDSDGLGHTSYRRTCGTRDRLTGCSGCLAETLSRISVCGAITSSAHTEDRHLWRKQTSSPLAGAPCCTRGRTPDRRYGHPRRTQDAPEEIRNVEQRAATDRGGFRQGVMRGTRIEHPGRDLDTNTLGCDESRCRIRSTCGANYIKLLTAKRVKPVMDRCFQT